MMGRLLAIAALTAVVSACASSGAVHGPRPFPTPGGGTGPTAGAPVPEAPPAVRGRVGGTPDGYALSGTALSLRGAPYQFGGEDPNGFDCSGFVRYVFDKHGLSVPREVRDQFRVGKNVARGQLEAGDLVFFSTVAPGASHVGIAIGPNQFVHAPSERGVVRVEQLTTPYWATRFIGAKRVK